MTTPTSMGNHGGTVTSCSPYAYPGFAEICILLRTWSTVTPGTCELAFLIKKKKKWRAHTLETGTSQPTSKPASMGYGMHWDLMTLVLHDQQPPMDVPSAVGTILRLGLRDKQRDTPSLVWRLLVQQGSDLPNTCHAPSSTACPLWNASTTECYLSMCCLVMAFFIHMSHSNTAKLSP